jgi:hypothetical protein
VTAGARPAHSERPRHCALLSSRRPSPPHRAPIPFPGRGGPQASRGGRWLPWQPCTADGRSKLTPNPHPGVSPPALAVPALAFACGHHQGGGNCESFHSTDPRPSRA